jgi:uncharacterized protein HemY
MCPHEGFHDPVAAIELARRALQSAPRADNIWNTLGVAHYRAGHWGECLEALDRSMALNEGGDGIDWFVTAMALARKGKDERARTWYVRALDWMDRHSALDGELRRLHTEATALLGLKEDPSALQRKDQGRPSPG